MKRVNFIRHAESIANAGHVSVNTKDMPLTDLGYQQAESLKNRIVMPDLFVVSPYLRTQHTAKPTLDFYNEIPVEMWEVQEFTYLSSKIWNNTCSADRKENNKAYWAASDPNYCDGDDAESFIHFVKRIHTTWETLLNHKHQYITIFSHGQFIKTLWWCLLSGNDLSISPTSEIMRKVNLFQQAIDFPNTGELNIDISDFRNLVFRNNFKC